MKFAKSIKMTIIFSVFGSNPAWACITPPTIIKLKDTFLEKNPIKIDGTTVYFMPGSSDEVKVTYDTQKNQWCYTQKKKDSSSDCLKDGDSATLEKLGTSIGSLKVEKNSVVITPENDKEASIRIVDKLDAKQDSIEVNARLCDNDRFSGCSGGRFSWQQSKTMRSKDLSLESAKASEVDLKDSPDVYEASCDGLKKVGNGINQFGSDVRAGK